MRAIRSVYLGLFGLLTGLWLWADPSWRTASGFFAWREAGLQLSGLLSLGAMSAALLLAVRPQRLEPLLGGLDKMYRLHKWLGISALVLALLHWGLKEGAGLVVDLGWAVRPPRAPRGELPAGLAGLMQQQRGFGKDVGQIGFYASCVLLALALATRFVPYRLFFKTHRWMALLYLLLALHGLLLLRYADWAQPLGWLLAVLLLLGSAAALVSLLRRVGIQRRVVASVEALEYHAESRVTRVDLRLADRWAGHAAGQFAFLTFDPAEGPHPFTIASDWKGDGHLFFLIKDSGDYTGRLASAVRPGQTCIVEGPYGRFVFDSGRPRQIWVAGGIGITPFIARLRALAGRPREGAQAIDLFWAVPVIEPEPLALLQADAAAAGVRLHLSLDGRDPRVSVAGIQAAVPQWAQGDVWFCGPAEFGHALRAGFAAAGLGAGRFHQELFRMR